MRAIDFFDRSAARFPERYCVRDGDNDITYAEAQKTSQKLAARLIQAGFDVEAKIGILSPNVSETIPAILGTIRSGCSWLPVNARNSIADNIAILTNNDCECLLYHSTHEDVTRDLLVAAPNVRLAVCIDKPGALGPDLLTWIADSPGLTPERGLGRDHCYKLALSGGTTGTPKGVEHTNLNAQVMISSLMIAFPHRKPPIYLCPTPVTHAAGNLALWILAISGTIVLMAKADAAEMLANIETYGATTLFAPPTVIYNLLAHETLGQHDFSTMEYFFYGAAPMSAQKLREAITAFGPVMAQIYSQAEATMALTFMRPEDHDVFGDLSREQRLKSAGRPGPLVEIEIMDDAGNRLAPGERGEIAVRSDLICRGYYKRPEETRAMSRDGWLLTSDIGYRDEDGFIYLVDRKRDLIITGGFNVYPGEVEQVISSIDPVLDVAVIGTPDDKWGEAVTAVIALKPGTSLNQEQVIDLCKSRLGSVKSPKRVVFCDSLPKNPNGKVLKRRIRDEYWSDRASKLV